jgi:hypothetical protein
MPQRHYPSRLCGLGVAAIVLGGLLGSAPSAPARGPAPNAAGAYFITCGPNKALIGISGGAGTWVDWVRGVCMHVTNDGHWIGAESPSPSFSGGQSGAPFRLMCPVDHVVAALSGNVGRWLNLLQVHCRRMTSNGAVSSTSALVLATPASAGSAGGSGSVGFGPRDCPNNQGALGLSGSSGSTGIAAVVDSARLVCGRPETFQITSFTLLANGVVAGSPTRGTVTFPYPAPVAQTIRPSSDNAQVAAVSLPSTAIAAGATSAGFSITTAGSTGGCTTIRVPNEHGLVDFVFRRLIVHPASDPDPFLTLVTRDDVSFMAPGAHTATIRMTTARPTTVALTSSDPTVATVPASVTVPPGAPGIAQFTMTALRTGCPTISATGRGTTVRRTVSFGGIGQ